MTILPAALLMCAGCYLAGAIPFGVLAGKLKGIDIRTQGSRNVGATNAGRLLGRRWGIGVFILDVAKGLLPVLLCGSALRSESPAWGLSGSSTNLIWLGAGVCCVLGHNYSLFLGFRGGKGVATSLGVVLGVYPYLTLPGLAAFGIWALVVLVTRYVSLGSVSAAVAFPVVFAVYVACKDYDDFGDVWPLFVFSILVAASVVYRHRANLGRLRTGTESRIGSKPSA